MKSTKACAGCRNDFYNGRQNVGGNVCWSLEDAVMVMRVPVHFHQMPPYKGKPEKVPSCYHQSQMTYIDPKRLDAEGYFK